MATREENGIGGGVLRGADISPPRGLVVGGQSVSRLPVIVHANGEGDFVNRVRATACLAAIALMACGGGNDQARTVPEPTPSAEPTVEMPTTSDESESAMEAPPADLESMVLTLDDMPSGWTTAPEMLSDDEATGTTFCGIDEAEIDVPDEAGASVDAAFKQSDFGPFVFHTVGRVGDAGEATAALDRMLNAASQCSEWTETDDQGVETTWSITPLSFDNVGDDTIAFRLSSETEGMPVTVDMVMWNRGPVLSVVGLFGIGGTDADLLTELVGIATGRM